ncbi:hypothetical protein BDV28DRAFT_139620 [Aspergillus coremiiformis]|uniref:Uncharacterized protein n=1 Tax=Aspergillus coremiiformis TaxID=138285 RepID=A0A5N6YZQ8_9EURO|nr:hypothetical protein BDV28DRAFT_139620 [Aspergillus coremiiformis]
MCIWVRSCEPCSTMMHHCQIMTETYHNGCYVLSYLNGMLQVSDPRPRSFHFWSPAFIEVFLIAAPCSSQPALWFSLVSLPAS